MRPEEAVLSFIDRINQHEADGLAELMTEDHSFIDSVGRIVRGRKQMLESWRAYFDFCPDYWVTHERILSDEHVVAVFGSAGGTVAANGSLSRENTWSVRAAWLAMVEDGLINEWRIYADLKPVYDIMARTQEPPP